MKNFMESLRRFAAPPSWDASFTPMLVGFTCAFTVGNAQLTYTKVLWMLLAFFAIALIETGKHALNEILDYQSGNDVILAEDHITPLSGGKKVLRYGLASVKQCWMIAAVTMGVACVAGLVIAFSLNIKILGIGIIGVLMAVVYNTPHIGFIYRGLGEPCIFIAYGPVCTMGAYYMFADAFSWIPFLLSLSLGFLIVNVLIMNELPDYEADVAAGKMNWVARLGKARGLTLYTVFFWLHYVPLVLLAVMTGEPIWLLTVLNIFTFRGVISNARANMDNIPALVQSNINTVTIHERAGIYINAALIALYLMH